MSIIQQATGIFNKIFYQKKPNQNKKKKPKTTGQSQSHNLKYLQVTSERSGRCILEKEWPSTSEIKLMFVLRSLEVKKTSVIFQTSKN